ncbi:MAG TPA: S66 peptidase family protein [Intrasporangium sp.]|uniref:S66 family peptidase n=1 Tax=Intrasporangium sp. TaxID=1925024 RepID=UPI002D7999F1|nr:S66 peptidase family protein [Intrasporangium sp.]HET7398574.1 S66 peptidase family protein [Intrasporangium sp.]
MVRYPDPLRPGDRIGVTAPSSGVEDSLWPRLEVAVAWLRDKGFEVELGDCLRAPTHVSAPRQARAAELMRLLTDPRTRAVVPPWGGETGIDLLDLLDVDAVATARPRWVVGFSDTSTWLTPLTLRTGLATIHGQNLMDTPYRPPDGVLHWLDVATAPAGSRLAQRSPERFRTSGHDDWERDPAVDRYTLDGRGTWARIDPGHEGEPVTMSGRLVGGCVETISFTAGGPWGDVAAFAAQHAPEGLLHYLDICEWNAYDVCRALHAMRLAGWFHRTNGILVSRTTAPDRPGFSQHDAVRDALGMLDVPIVADVECGHVAPYLALVNGAPATVVCGPDERSLSQSLV